MATTKPRRAALYLRVSTDRQTVENQRQALEEVARHRQHHVLTRAVGGPDPDLECDIHHLRVTAGDRLLLCSDGLTDMASESEIAAVLASHPASEDTCGALVELALRHGGRDNVTAIVAIFARA